MRVRLYCRHCEKHYEIALKDVRMVQAHHRDRFTFAHNTYYYDDGCFFTALNQHKNSLQK